MSDYAAAQSRMDREYEKAADEWLANASPSDVQDMIARGLVRTVAVKGGAPKYVFADTGREPTPTSGMIILGHEVDAALQCDMRSDLATSDDMAAYCDGLVDELRERYRLDAEEAQLVCGYIKEKVERAAKEVHATLLSRIVGVLIESTTNQQARAHALLHAVPRLAAISGYPSMRKSAEACDCSVEWIRKMRAKWCTELGIPIPEESSKSAEAREKYKTQAINNHWRHRTCTPTTPATPNAEARAK